MFDFGMRLQKLRMSRNLSQAALGKKINRSKSVICAYENNLRIPPLEAAFPALFFLSGGPLTAGSRKID